MTYHAKIREKSFSSGQLTVLPDRGAHLASEKRIAQIIILLVDAACHRSDFATMGDDSGSATRAKFDEIHAEFMRKSCGFRVFSRGFLHFRRASEGDVGRTYLLIFIVSNNVTI